MSLADPVFVALVNKLPLPGAYWPLDERLAWLQACESVFNLIYGREPQPIFIKADGDNLERLKEEFKKSGKLVVGAYVEETPKPPAAPMVDPPSEQTAVTKNDTLKRVKRPQVRPERSAPAPRVGARRPEGIPTTFTMIQTILKEADAFSLTARDVMAKIEERWWPGLGPTFLGPDISSFISMYRLTRNADGKLALTEKGASMISEDLRHRTKGEFQEPKPELKPSVAEAVKTIVEELQAPPQQPSNPKIVMEPKARGPRPTVDYSKPPAAAPKAAVAQVQRAAAQPVKFDHGELTTYLPTMRHYVLAGKLRVAMGKGYVSEAFLAEQTLGSNTENNRMLVKDLCLGMNEAMAVVGLKVEHYPGFGLLMKDID